MILVFCLYALLASTFTLGKMLLLYTSPLLLTSLRMISAGLLLLVGSYIFSASSRRIQTSDILLLFGLSWIHIFIPYTTEFIALQSIAPSCAALMYNLSPFCTALFSYIFFKEKMTFFKWLGLVLGFSGIIFFVQPTVGCLHATIDWSYFFILISVFFAALGWILVRLIMKQRALSITIINGWAMLFAGLQSLVVAVFFEQSIDLPWGHMQNFLMLLITIIFIANILFYNLYGYLLKKYTATFLSFVGFVTPLFTAFYDWFFLGYPIDSNFIITIIVISFGIYLFYKEELRQGYIIQE